MIFMKTYTSLFIDIIRFDAQDVITTSVVDTPAIGPAPVLPAPDSCSCPECCFEYIDSSHAYFFYYSLHDKNSACNCEVDNHYYPN